MAAFNARSAEFFIATNGLDSNPGSFAKPFATLERAREQARTARGVGGSQTNPLTIYLRGGDYLRTNSFEISSPDSGSVSAPVSWRAYKEEQVRLLGGITLTGFAPVSDLAVLNRLDPAARTNVLQIDLRKAGVSKFEEMQSRGFALARWPNGGESEHIAGFPEDQGQNDGHGGRLGSLEQGFWYSGDRPRRWKDTSDLWVHGYWAWDWANSYERVTALDVQTHSIKTASPFGLYGFRKGQRFQFLNVLEELDQPGEWFLDRKIGVLYFWPPTPIGSGETLLSLLGEPILKLTGVSLLEIRGLAIEATRGNAIEIRGGATNLVKDCVLRNIGDWGVYIEGGSGHLVSGCGIYDTGDGGVSLDGGDRATLMGAGHVVEECHFARQGRWSKCYVPAILMGGVGMRAAHNLIHDHPHCAILFSGNDHTIEFNEIHHIALETGDVGAIYSGRDYTFRGNRIRNNFIHHTGGVHG